MTDAAAATAKLEIGRVIRETFGVLGRNFPTILVLSLVLVALPALIQQSGTGGRSTVAFNDMSAAGWVAFGVGSLLLMIGYYVLQGALVHGAVADMNGRRASAADGLRTGMRHVLPLIGIAILMGLGLVLGFIALVVPGLMLMTAWSVTAPAQVVEDVGVTKAFGRSLALTRGNRWRIFGLLILYGVLSWVLQVALGVIGLLGGPASPIAVVIAAVTSTLNAMIGATGAAVLYFELRRIKEGVGPEALASVFD